MTAGEHKTKLTLAMDPELIEEAKRYAKAHGTSVSELIANYFRALSASKYTESELQPQVKRLMGCLTVQEGDDPKAAYKAHLDQKYRK